MRLTRVAVATVLSMLLGACSATGALSNEQAGQQDASPAVDMVGAIDLEPSSGLPGSTVVLTGEGLPAGSQLTVRWGTVDGAWNIQGDRLEEYHGRIHEPMAVDLGTLEVDGEGRARTTFEVPEGFGFAHDVVLMDSEGVIRNKALFDVDIEVSISPTEGPIGTPITIEVRGMGWQSLENTRTILYDNSYVGFMSAVTTRGTARATIPAVGAPGPHLISMNRGAFTFPYLNPQQSPRPDIPEFEAVFTVTEGDPVLPASIESQNQAPEPRVAAALGSEGPSLTTDFESGAVETPLTVTGEGFPPGETVELAWYRVIGNRVSGAGWDETSIPFGEATVDADGRLSVEAVVPHDVGGAHRIEAQVNGSKLAEVDFEVIPAVASVTPTQGEWGTEFTISLTGVGWTETANIYTLTYDNSYIGYACGFNSQGDVDITLSAVGAPGWHFIDLYPAIYKGEESPGQQVFRIPQLTYADDHPGEDLPAFHLAFLLEG